MKEICSECKGTGEITYVEGEVHYNGIDITISEPCSKCNGSGRLDWVEQIVGKHPTHRMMSPGVYVREVDLSLGVLSNLTGKKADMIIVDDIEYQDKNFRKKLLKQYGVTDE